MSAVNDKYKNLISYLEKSSIACISDQEEVFSIDKEGNEYFEAFKPMAHLSFNNDLNVLNELRQEFYDEITNNQFTLGFNLNLYFSEAITEFNNLLKKFTSINIDNLEIKIRTDLCVKYLDYLETNYSGDMNGIGVSSPVEIVLAKDQYGKIPTPLLKKISAYFRLQEKYIKSVLTHLNKFYQPSEKRGYNKDYLYDYFMFDHTKIGKRRSKKDCINSFFSAIIDAGLISGDNSLKHLTLYFDNKHPRTYSKVIWNGSGRQLYEFIRQLTDRKFLYESKGSTSNIIIKIFVKPDGSDFTQNELYSQNPSKKMIKAMSNFSKLLLQ
jgi:hypothetical protein